MLSLKSSKEFAAVEKLSVELKDLNLNFENKVKERTEELEAANVEMLAMNESHKQTSDAMWGEI